MDWPNRTPTLRAYSNSWIIASPTLIYWERACSCWFRMYELCIGSQEEKPGDRALGHATCEGVAGWSLDIDGNTLLSNHCRH